MKLIRGRAGNVRHGTKVSNIVHLWSLAAFIFTVVQPMPGSNCDWDVLLAEPGLRAHALVEAHGFSQLELMNKDFGANGDQTCSQV